MESVARATAEWALTEHIENNKRMTCTKKNRLLLNMYEMTKKKWGPKRAGRLLCGSSDYTHMYDGSSYKIKEINPHSVECTDGLFIGNGLRTWKRPTSVTKLHFINADHLKPTYFLDQDVTPFSHEIIDIDFLNRTLESPSRKTTRVILSTQQLTDFLEKYKIRKHFRKVPDSFKIHLYQYENSMGTVWDGKHFGL